MAATKQSRFLVLLATLIVVGLVIVAVGLYFINLQFLRIKSMNDGTQVLQEEVRHMSDDLQHLHEKQGHLDELNKELAILDKHKIEYEYMPSYLEQLQKTCTATGNVIQTIQPHEIKPLDLTDGPLAPAGKKPAAVPDPTAPPPDPNAPPAKPKGPQYRVQQIIVEVRGTYATVFNLLNALRQFPKMVYVRSVGITPQNNDRVGRAGEVIAHLETFAIISPEQYQHQQPAVDAAHAAKPAPGGTTPASATGKPAPLTGKTAPAPAHGKPAPGAHATAPAPAKPAAAPTGGKHE